MGRGRRNLPPAVAAGPKERHKRAQRPQYDHLAPVPEGYVAKPAVPKSKHHTYFEIVDNKEKKMKKLEFEVTTKKTPPPGFEFVPIGNPQLTTACKELSREKDAMIFIVSNAKGSDSSHLVNQVHRIGFHVREAIVEEAKAALGDPDYEVLATMDGKPEPIPESQTVYHAQVDAAIRDLFPRIPNTDRQMIVEHAFTRGSTNKPEKVVGFSEDISLARRVQLAVLAHIRHTHTRYDALLKETTWQIARKVVEGLCLDILVKWRGDEETGRDQLDEILREVVVISDSEGDSEDESTDISSVEDTGATKDVIMPDYRTEQDSHYMDIEPSHPPVPAPRIQDPLTPTPNTVRLGEANRDRRVDKRAQRGFKRYRAWEEAIRRNRGQAPETQYSSSTLAPTQSSYQQHGSVADCHGHHERTHISSDSETARPPGSSPTLNSYVLHRPLVYESSSVNTSPYTSRIDPVVPSIGKVMSDAHSLESSSSRLPHSPASSRLQDILVHSIEPVSPSSRPVYVRAIPPARRGQMGPQPPDDGLQHAPGPGLHFANTHTYLDDRSYTGRGQVSLPSSERDARLAAFPNGGTAQPTQSIDTQQSRPTNNRPALASPLYYPAPRAQEVGSVGVPVSRTIVVNAPRPGERSNPILMEDRGGFYERIITRPENASQPQTQDFRTAQVLPPVSNVQGIVRPHRVVSWDEESHLVKSSQAPIEMIPQSGSHPRVASTSSYHQPSHDYLVPQRQYHRPTGEQPRYDYRDASNFNSRPVLRMEYGAPPPEGYWVIQRNDRPIAPPQHNASALQERNIRPTVVEQRYDLRRRDHHNQPQAPPPGVIVFE